MAIDGWFDGASPRWGDVDLKFDLVSRLRGAGDFGMVLHGRQV
jgi:hypothetical protein